MESKISEKNKRALLAVGAQAHDLYYKVLTDLITKMHNAGELSDQEESYLNMMREKLEDVSMGLTAGGFFYMIEPQSYEGAKMHILCDDDYTKVWSVKWDNKMGSGEVVERKVLKTAVKHIGTYDETYKDINYGFWGTYKTRKAAEERLDNLYQD